MRTCFWTTNRIRNKSTSTLLELSFSSGAVEGKVENSIVVTI